MDNGAEICRHVPINQNVFVTQQLMTPRDIIASEILEVVGMAVEISTCVTDIYQRAGTDFCSVKRWQLLTLGARATAKQTIKAGFLGAILPSQMAWLLEKFVSRTHIVVVTG